jgi:hypothetical protein
MQRIYEFRTGRFSIRADIRYSDCPDLSFDETGETAEKIESGEWTAFDTRVSVWLNGAMVGEDWLCESIYADPSDFFTDHRSVDPMNRNCSIMRAAKGGNVSICHYFPAMVSQAIADARGWMAAARIAA